MASRSQLLLVLVLLLVIAGIPDTAGLRGRASSVRPGPGPRGERVEAVRSEIMGLALRLNQTQERFQERLLDLERLDLPEATDLMWRELEGVELDSERLAESGRLEALGLVDEWVQQVDDELELAQLRLELVQESSASVLPLVDLYAAVQCALRHGDGERALVLYESGRGDSDPFEQPDLVRRLLRALDRAAVGARVPRSFDLRSRRIY